jgi:hypothetical protein
MRGHRRYALRRTLLAAGAALLVGAGTAVGATVSGTPDGGPPPWYAAPQTITWSVDDPLYTFSGQPTAATTAATNGVNTYDSPQACNGADCLEIGHVTLGLDLTAPTISAVESPGPNAFGWNKVPVTVSFPCSDGLSGLAGPCPTAVTLGETAGETVTRSVSDNVGHIGSATSAVIRIDMTPPNIAAAGQSPAKNAQGWNNTSVTAVFSCSDPGTFASGVDPSAIDPTYDPTDDPSAVSSGIPGCPTVTKTASGAGQTATTTVTDRAGNVSGPATVTGINIDKSPPTVTVSVPGSSPPSYDQGQVVAPLYSCGDQAGLSGVLACAGPVASGGALDTAAGGTNQPFSVTGTDNAGNATTVARSYKIKPAAPQLVTPANGVTTNDATPEFRWNNSAGSSIKRYELWVKGEKKADVAQGACVGMVCQTAIASVNIGPPFALAKTALQWFVRAVGVNDTTKDSLIRTVTYDPSVPNAPTLTGGPVGVTNQATPTFTWAGSGTSFPWKVRRSSDDAVIQQGTAGGLQVTVGPLPDGAYTFEVQQAGANGVTGDAAVLAFTVDATPPGPPTIVSGPGASTDVRTPAFAWVGEAGGTFTWTVLGGGGAVRSGTTAARSATVTPALDPGAWTFVVQQVDAAGNASAPSAGYTFTITPPPAPSTPPGTTTTAAAKPPSTVTAKKGKRSNSVLTPRTINARMLSPKAGAKIRSLTPVLRWKLHPKGVKIYNLQMFLNSKKILSRFPTGQSFKVPKGVLKAGKRYVWRIWPYFGPKRGYPSKPIGLSFLDTVVVKKKTVAKGSTKR